MSDQPVAAPAFGANLVGTGRSCTGIGELNRHACRVLAQHLELSEDEASLVMRNCQAWWWIHWAQWDSIKMRAGWNLSPAVGFLEPDFRGFVNAALQAKPDNELEPAVAI